MGILGVILAGGQSRRMGGGDKCLKLLGDKLLLSYICERLEPQVDAMILSANGTPERFAEFGIPVVSDGPNPVRGPLAGILAGMDWAAAHDREFTHIASVAADTPFFPDDLVARLKVPCAGSLFTIALATSDGVTHPVFGLWPMMLRPDLARWGTETDDWSVMSWAARHPLAKVPFAFEELTDGRMRDPFFNINSPDDLASAEAFVAQ